MLIRITCPTCQTEGSFSLIQDNYNGPYKCWKCREFFTLRLENNELKSCEPLSEEEYQKLQDINSLRSKYQR